MRSLISIFTLKGDGKVYLNEPYQNRTGISMSDAHVLFLLS